VELHVPLGLSVELHVPLGLTVELHVTLRFHCGITRNPPVSLWNFT
jgi:hypothetical protein